MTERNSFGWATMREPPELVMTPDQFLAIESGPFTNGYLEVVAPIGFRFRHSKDVYLIGEICEGLQMYGHQWPYLCVPPRGVRWMRAKVVELEVVE